ncbi:uncharacterized protein PAC_19025 [Phialocephala subalpina]|uniref:Uncharacterized protein n=1 Tax=Phialocephala subalpina TaxID=576137 RepID=A0A1L7XVX4_9HELO|nr:uncharacterized protein PAC_19025 [Phialocephala subalpina]
MMTSVASYSPHPGGMQPHPGMAQGHPMGVPHNPGQPGQPGPGMPQQMHMGVSGPGPQVSQGAMIGGMPPGAGGPSQHALQHLNPDQKQQAQIFQQQQAMAFANNPSMQQLQQQQMIQHQRQQQAARQAMLAQQYSGMPGQMGPNPQGLFQVPQAPHVQMQQTLQNLINQQQRERAAEGRHGAQDAGTNAPNSHSSGMNQMTQAQFRAMRGNPMARPVNLPQHLQQQQQQAEHSLQQQQAQAKAQAQHHQHQQQLIMAQQIAMQQQANAQAQAGNSSQGQPNQMNPQQGPNMQAQTAMMQQAHQQQQQTAQAAAASQQQQQLGRLNAAAAKESKIPSKKISIADYRNMKKTGVTSAGLPSKSGHMRNTSAISGGERGKNNAWEHMRNQRNAPGSMRPNASNNFGHEPGSKTLGLYRICKAPQLSSPHSTISTDNTAGYSARKATLFAELAKNKRPEARTERNRGNKG